VLRHTALFMWRDATGEEQQLAAKKGLAYLRYGCPSVREVDFGTDLLGGSSPLREIKPWDRTPLWDARPSGPPSNFDLALHLDFDDREGLDAYNKDDAHHEVAAYNASVCRPDRTARVDWWYEGPPRVERGAVRHTDLYLWDDDAPGSARADVQEAFSSLAGSVPGVRSVLVADNVGTLRTDYDMIVDVHLDGLPEAEAFLAHSGYREAVTFAAAATKFEWTARITHRIASG
jgi:hypothetical protein